MSQSNTPPFPYPLSASAPPAVARRSSQVNVDADSSISESVRIARQQADLVRAATNQSPTPHSSRRTASTSARPRSRSTTSRPLPAPPLGDRVLWDQPNRYYDRRNQGRNERAGREAQSLYFPQVAQRNPHLQTVRSAIDLREMANNAAAYSPVENSGPVNNRAPASPANSSAGQVNGNGAVSASYMTPPQVGHQQDLVFLYGMIQDLSALLKENRDKVTVLTEQARRLAARGVANGNLTNGETDIAVLNQRINDLEYDLANHKHLVGLYKHEQVENTKLIAEYEEAVGNMTEQVRNYASGHTERYLALRRHYNGLLQQEKDDHLKSRLQSDEWHAKFMMVAGWIREANRLRGEELGEEIHIIAQLQAEVRIYRRCLGEDQQKPEEETGWEWLKQAQSPADQET